MISRHVFKVYVVDKLSTFFDIPSDGEAKELYELFKNTNEPVMFRATEILTKKHRYKSFPLPAEFDSAIQEAREEHTRDSIDPDIPRENCYVCYGMGIQTKDKNGRKVAVPCGCSAGKIIAKAWAEYDMSRRRRI